MTAASLAVWGLALNSIGTVLLFLFGVPGVFSPYSKYVNWLPDDATKAKVSARKWWSWWGSGTGLALMIVGNVLQGFAVM